MKNKCSLCGKKRKGKKVIIGDIRIQFFVCDICLKKEKDK